MYHFNTPPGGKYQHPQFPAPGGYNNAQGPPIQTNQVYPHQQNLSAQQQHYQVPPQAARPPMPQYSGYHPAHESQAPVFNGYGGDQRQAPTRNSSYTNNLPFTSQQPAVYASIPLATMPPQAAQCVPQASMPNNAFQRAPRQQTPQGRAKSFPNRLGESCYNCGAPDHWAQDCPEPRRAVPVGQMNRPSKRQKTHGGIAAANHRVLQQPPPNLQRAWTDPAAAQQTILMSNNSPHVQATQANGQRPWTHNQFQSSFTPASAGPNRQNSWGQQQYHQSGNQNVTGSNYQPWSVQAPSQPHSFVAPASTSDRQTWTLQQPRLDGGTMLLTRFSEHSAVSSHNSQAEGAPASQATPWPAPNLPTPAPSSIDSQIPSPATSNLNPIDQYAQSTPRHTESPRIRHDSVSSTHKKNQHPRTQQAEMVASLFSGAVLTPASKSNSPESVALVEESVDDTENELEELYGLDFPDIVFEQNITVSTPAFLVAEPLSSKDELDENEQPRMANTSWTAASLSKYLRDMQGENFLKNVQESSEWDKHKSDPVFAKIKANTATVTFNELIERRCNLVRALAEAEANDQQYDQERDQGVDRNHQETEEERLTRGQEERLAALGVTGPAKPMKASPTEVPLETPSPAKTLVARRVSGDPGWKHYENGRAVEHRSTSFESPSSATKDDRSIGSAQHHSPSDTLEKAGHESPNTDGPEQQPYRKRTYSETSEEIENMPKRHATEPKQRKPKFKQPNIAAAYG